MAFLISILTGTGQWLLKVFLGGLFNKVMTQIEDEAQHKLDAAVVQAQTTNDAAAVEIQIVKDEAAAKEKVDAMKPTSDDPFGNANWNK